MKKTYICPELDIQYMDAEELMEPVNISHSNTDGGSANGGNSAGPGSSGPGGGGSASGGDAKQWSGGWTFDLGDEDFED